MGREVWVRHDRRLIRIFDESLRHITTHVVTEWGRFQTDPTRIASEKISPIVRGISYLHAKMRLIGPQSSRWAEVVLAMSRKHPSEEIERASQSAWRSAAINRRIIGTLLMRQATGSQTTIEFMDDHAIIRPIGEYATDSVFVASESFGEFRSVLHRFELAFRERIVVGNMRPAMRFRHPQRTTDE